MVLEVGVDAVNKRLHQLQSPTPNSAREIHNFLSLAGHYRKDATIICKDVKFDLADACSNSFSELKRQLTKTPKTRDTILVLH